MATTCNDADVDCSDFNLTPRIPDPICFMSGPNTVRASRAHLEPCDQITCCQAVNEEDGVPVVSEMECVTPSDIEGYIIDEIDMSIDNFEVDVSCDYDANYTTTSGWDPPVPHPCNTPGGEYTLTGCTWKGWRVIIVLLSMFLIMLVIFGPIIMGWRLQFWDALTNWVNEEDTGKLWLGGSFVIVVLLLLLYGVPVFSRYNVMTYWTMDPEDQDDQEDQEDP